MTQGSINVWLKQFLFSANYISEKDATDSYENSEHMLLLLNLVVIAVVLLAVHRSTVSARQADIWMERQSKEKQKPDKV